jgi:phage-related protein
LNVSVKTWQEGVDFEKDDIVYLPTNTSTTTNFRLGDIFYCKKDHNSSQLRNPFYGRDAKSFWTQDFEWQPDEKFETRLGFQSEEFGNKFKTRRKEENAAVLEIKYLFSSVSDKQALAMLHFLETRAGYRRFRYQIPSIYNRPKIFISESWEHQWNYDNNHTIVIDLTEDKLGVMPKEKADNYYTQASFYRKKFSTDYLSDSERFGYYDGTNNWIDYQTFFSDFDDQSSNPDNFYIPPITDPTFDPGDINSGVFGVDTKSYIGASVEETISTDIPDSWNGNWNKKLSFS